MQVKSSCKGNHKTAYFICKMIFYYIFLQPIKMLKILISINAFSLVIQSLKKKTSQSSPPYKNINKEEKSIQ